MPILNSPTYVPPILLRNGHLQTLVPYLFRRVTELKYNRERVDTPDGDFIDIDFCPSVQGDTDSVVILSHGLEGNSQTPYMRGMAKYFTQLGVDAVAWNMRSCSGEMNRLPMFYHSGLTQDLELAIEYALTKKNYTNIYLVGFSLGAGLTAMYLGQNAKTLNPKIKKAVVFSAPCCLKSSGEELASPAHRIYSENLLMTMRKKVLEKDQIMGLPMLDLHNLHKVKTFQEFDDRVTSKLLGYQDAQEYYRKNSCLPFLENINIPTLIVNAKNDPFLGKKCYPIREAYKNSSLYLEMPKSGGHLGFFYLKKGPYWSEQRAAKFILED
jgi:predicted alpha/beta-fold hydrolase